MQNNIAAKQELAEALRVKIRQIGNYIKKGMPIHSTGKRGIQMFDVKKCQAWKNKNIDISMSIKTLTPKKINLQESEDDDNEEKKGDLERKLKADADDAELKVQLNKIKLAEAEGRVVDANDLDKAMSELAIVHKTDKIHDENLLPILLENKDAGEIKKLLQDHNQNRLEMLHTIINKEFKSIETMYDIVEVVLHQLKNGIEPESLIKRLRGSLI